MHCRAKKRLAEEMGSELGWKSGEWAGSTRGREVVSKGVGSSVRAGLEDSDGKERIMKGEGRKEEGSESRWKGRVLRASREAQQLWEPR